jgi:hypothetical protein
MSATEQGMVIVRRRWNAPNSVQLPMTVMREFHYRNEAGGVCRAMPRAFLCAHVWCDQVPAEALGHTCRDDPPPHDLLVCILSNDNAPALYQELLVRLRRW